MNLHAIIATKLASLHVLDVAVLHSCAQRRATGLSIAPITVFDGHGERREHGISATIATPDCVPSPTHPRDACANPT
jgi:hypothetical protein